MNKPLAIGEPSPEASGLPNSGATAPATTLFGGAQARKLLRALALQIVPRDALHENIKNEIADRGADRRQPHRQAFENFDKAVIAQTDRFSEARKLLTDQQNAAEAGHRHRQQAGENGADGDPHVGVL